MISALSKVEFHIMFKGLILRAETESDKNDNKMDVMKFNVVAHECSGCHYEKHVNLPAMKKSNKQSLWNVELFSVEFFLLSGMQPNTTSLQQSGITVWNSSDTIR